MLWTVGFFYTGSLGCYRLRLLPAQPALAVHHLQRLVADLPRPAARRLRLRGPELPRHRHLRHARARHRHRRRAPSCARLFTPPLAAAARHRRSVLAVCALSNTSASSISRRRHPDRRRRSNSSARPSAPPAASSGRCSMSSPSAPSCCSAAACRRLVASPSSRSASPPDRRFRARAGSSSPTPIPPPADHWHSRARLALLAARRRRRLHPHPRHPGDLQATPTGASSNTPPTSITCDVDAIYLGRVDDKRARRAQGQGRATPIDTGNFEPNTLYSSTSPPRCGSCPHLQPGDLLANIDSRIVFARGGAGLVDGLGIDAGPRHVAD